MYPTTSDSCPRPALRLGGLGLVLTAGVVVSTGCVQLPDVYLIDRHTVMESEASGEWPELEQRFREAGVSKGPRRFAEDPLGGREDRALRVLNGEFPTDPEPELSPPAPTPITREAPAAGGEAGPGGDNETGAPS